MNLLPEQEEKLVNFQAVTDNWDTESSLEILKRNNWDLEMATHEFMNGTTRTFHGLPEKRAEYFEENLESHENFQSFDSSVQNSPEPKNFFQKIKSFFSEMMTDSQALQSKAADDFRQKIRNSSPLEMPVFMNLVLKDMIQETKKQRKLLFMYLSSSFIPSQYTVEVLCNPRSLSLLKTHFLVWAVERESSEGKVAENLLKATSFPCFAIVSVENPARPVVLSKIEGQFPSEYITEFLSAQFTPLRPVDPRQEELERERQLRMMQDQELKAAEKIVEERKRLEDIRKNEEIKAKMIREANKNAKIEIVGPEAEGADAVFVSFRLPNGTKIERRFFKGRTVQVLYDFLEIQDLADVEILFGFPAVILTDKSLTLEDAGLYPKALVIVRKIEDN